ncbi:hypothetical protein LOTGIDRAFT_218462 [Lottia gigantea]|uniref:Peptidase M12B domain-containing protein n=1 Tax=Lottia gigantea TaxID=225164 RepID=V3ZFP6_LOTGI|nr:hypothetical protein LOTGIDRAFT_218462 [Lottia gigantea]ESO89988.1 hypothetical protein LOTGIDRAFT_218462 [Lottia gigantea]
MTYTLYFVISLVIQSILGDIDKKLFYYETLSTLEDVKRTKRSTDGIVRNTDRDIKFSAFGRTFDLLLKNNDDILAQGFKASIIKHDGSSSGINVNKNQLFKGRLAGEKDSMVDAHVENGKWTANIYTAQESYHIEPSWRHLPHSRYYSQIIYRASDIKSNFSLPSFKGEKLADGIKVDVDPNDIIYDDKESIKTSNRSKRQISKASTCQIYVVADHLFHQGIGGGLPHTTVNYLINTFQTVDGIFRRTKWEGTTDLTNIGFQIKEIKIHEKATPVKNTQHYNMAKEKAWATRDLLEVFSRERYHDKFCLAHLVTYQKFSGGVLGLAYIASPRQRTVGGICSPAYMKDKIRLKLNTGWSSSKNTNGDRLLTKEAILVTTHELGHNWGSEHDAETDECAPSSLTGKGKFVMYPYAVKGYDENNDKFSPCSRRYVRDVLIAKASNCFTDLNAPYCGNGKIDSGEECDGGRTGKEGNDPCCSKDCKLIGNAVCSNVNYECCVDCQVASTDTVCREAFKGGCTKTAKCSGSLECPPSEYVGNTTQCLEGGECYDGICVSYCELNNAEPCRCENNEKDACHRCCRDQQGKCSKFGNEKLPQGRACYIGSCSADGVCKRNEVDMVQRLFSFIEKLTPNAFVEFMKRNIVATILIFSMIIWVPVSCKISCIVSITLLL